MLYYCQGKLWRHNDTIKYATNSAHTKSSHRPYGVLTTFPQRPYSVHDAFTAHKNLMQRAHG